ncbi:hypothetical protein HID58_001241 [Brassica napus]|uniref:Uncharacterized protein n=1 Tax=Brassica napus TaxID=3708 RepID=A0ABQ8EJ08_BRANA|nr:hypothetical protein HID58_001241 [Brassica napus]
MGSDRETSNNRVSSRSQNTPPHYERRRDVTHDNTSHQTYKRPRDFLKDRLSGGYHREPPAYKRSRYDAPRDRGETPLSRGTAKKRQMEYREREASPRTERKQQAMGETQRLERSSSSRSVNETPARGVPLQEGSPQLLQQIPHEALEGAMEEVRDVMTKYTNCVDPTERAARQERFRLAEEEGEVEVAATNMLLAELANHELTPLEEPITVSPRVPALQRLGPSIETASPEMAEPILKRKPGRPPGPRRIQSSPKMLQGSCSKKRKTQQTKPPLARRKLSTARGSGGTGAVVRNNNVTVDLLSIR